MVVACTNEIDDLLSGHRPINPAVKRLGMTIKPPLRDILRLSRQWFAGDNTLKNFSKQPRSCFDASAEET